MGPPGAKQPLGGAGQPHLAVAWPLLRCGVLLSFLEPSRVDFVAEKHDFFDDLILLDGFLDKPC